MEESIRIHVFGLIDQGGDDGEYSYFANVVPRVGENFFLFDGDYYYQVSKVEHRIEKGYSGKLTAYVCIFLDKIGRR